MWRPEPWHVRWGRRAITFPAAVLLTLLHGALLPLLLLHGVIVDLRAGRRMVRARFHLVSWCILAWHIVGIASLGIWWVVGKARGLTGARWVQFHRALEAWWGWRVLHFGTVFYRTRFVVDGLDVVAPGPVLVLSRHASTLDTILPLRVLGRPPLGLVTRIVMKRELLWDPCVDLVSHRVPRTFIRRGTSAVREELARLEHLCGGADHDDAIVIFPEGTRFTPAKRDALIARLDRKDPAAAARARELANVLPIRPLGTLALLDAVPTMDVVFCAHTGLEETESLDDLIDGALLDATVRIKYWRVPRAQVPTDETARILWLHRWWRKVDDWIDAHRRPSTKA
jgi:1-acyl-sn-glycerol-3-phosphate acyltransferase